MKQYLFILLAVFLAGCQAQPAPGAEMPTQEPTTTPAPVMLDTYELEDTYEPTPAQLVTVTPTPTPAQLVCVVTAEALNIREGAGIQYAIIGYLAAGDTVTAAQPGAWLDIGNGYINSKYVECEP